MKNNIILILLVMFSVATAYSQTAVIKGKIVSEETNNPIEYATIKMLKNKSVTVSNANGEFFVQAEDGDKAEISHISFKTIVVDLQNELLVKMQSAQIDLSEIIVDANPLRDISQSVIINDIEKRVSQPRSVGHLFKDIPGFAIVKRGAYASEPVFRSFKQEQLNVQYDGGMKIHNACPSRMDPITTHVIPEEIEKIEIVKGPFTVRFGQNFGGIINLVSKNPSKNELGFHGSVEGGYETNGQNMVNGASLVYVAKKFDVQLNGSYRDFGDYTDGNGDEVQSSFRTTDYSVKVGVNPTDNQRLQFSWRQSFARNIEHAGLPMDSPYDDSLLAGVDYKFDNISEKISSFTFKAFYSYVDHLMTNENRPTFLATDAKSPVESFSYGGKAEMVFNTSENSKLFAGVDANLLNRKGDRTRIVKIMNGNVLPAPKTFVDKIWQDADVNDIGIFAEEKIKITDYTTITAGIRADFISAKLNDPAPDFEALYGGEIKDESEVNIGGNASVKYQKNGFQTQFAVGRGIRTASMTERFINHFNVGVDPYEYVGNPNLKPEINYQVEMSVLKKFEAFEVGASVFHSFLQDYIYGVVNTNIPRKFMPTTPPVYAKQFVNIDKASQTGFEFNFKVSATDKLSFTSELSYTRAQNEDLDEPLAQIPPLMANLGVKFEENKFWFALNSRLVAKQDRVSASFMEEETPGFGTLDLRAGITAFTNFSIGFAVLNIFDKNYYEHLNYSYQNSNTSAGHIYETGRNFTAYLKYQF